MPPPLTNFYYRTTHSYWLDSKIFNQSEQRCVNHPIRDYIVFTQNKKTGSWGLPLLYIYTSIIETFLLLEILKSFLLFSFQEYFQSFCVNDIFLFCEIKSEKVNTIKFRIPWVLFL